MKDTVRQHCCHGTSFTLMQLEAEALVTDSDECIVL